MATERKIFWFWGCLTLFLGIHANAQNLNFSFRHINANDLLPENHVKCFFRDSTGFAWMGTHNGLARFDGVNMETFQNTPKNVPGLKGYNVNGILKDKNGNFWIGTDYGINFFNIRTNSFRNYPVIPDENNMCYTEPIAVDGFGKVWLFAASKYALFVLDATSGKLTHIPCKADLEYGVNTAGVTGTIKKMAFRLFRGVVLYDIDNYLALNEQQYFSPQGKFSDLIINDARFFFPPGNDSILWITCDRGLIKLNYKSSGYKLYNAYNNKPVGETTDLCFYNGLMFVASAYNGLFLFNPEKGDFTAHIENNPFDANSLFSNKLSRLFISDNTLFAAFDDGGVDFASLKTVFTHFVSKEEAAALGIKNQVSSACVLGNGAAVLGTYENGLVAYNTAKKSIDTAKTETLAKLLPAKHVNNIETAGIYTAVSSSEGLFVYKTSQPGAGPILPVVRGNVNYLAFFNDSVLLATNDDGLFQINITGGGFATKPVADYYKEENLKSLSIYPIKGENIVYVMAEYGSYLHEMEFDGKGFHVKRKIWLTQDNVFITGGANDSLLLLCGSRGIISFNRKSFTFSNLEGRVFSNKQVYAVLRMKSGNWFVAYNKGVAVYDGLFLHLVASFDEADGLYNTSFSPNACRLLPDGDIMLGSGDGVFVYHNPGDGAAPATAPQLYMADIKVNDGEHRFAKAINYVDSLRLNYDENTVSFSFSVVDFSASPGKRLEYMMEGIDNGWVPAQRNGFARYARLRPGNYTFKIRNYEDASGGAVKTVFITILKPFWGEWWFILACILAVCCLGYAIYLYRIQELIRLQRVRNRIATDLHDDIGSTLTNINILAELSSVNINNSGKASLFIKRISEEVTATSESLDDIVWSINTGNDNFNQMAARMRRYASELFEHGDIKWEVLFDENFGSKKLTMDQRRDIYLIFKEAVNNIYKHAAATHVKITLQLQKGKMVMEIRDNGKGFNPDAWANGNGVKNIRSRTKKWGGNCTITSSPAGSAIVVAMPLFSSSLK